MQRNWKELESPRMSLLAGRGLRHPLRLTEPLSAGVCGGVSQRKAVCWVRGTAHAAGEPLGRHVTSGAAERAKAGQAGASRGL